MNTLSRLDSYLASLGERLPQPPPSSSIPPPAQYAPPSVPTGVDVASAASSFTSSFTPPTARRLSDLPPRRRKRRRRPTGTSIKLPPPTTPLVIRFVLALWSILLSFWRSLVGDTRAVRERRRGSRLNALPAAPVSTCTSDNTGLATIPSIRIGDAASSDEASASEAEPSDREWVDPVTRAPENAQVDEPSDNEFRPRTPSSDPTFSFRLRSAQSKDTVSISGSMDVASAGSSSSLQPTPFAPLARSTTPPSILQGPVLNQTRSARLLPNPMQTSLLDPSVPAVPHRVVTPSIMSPPRPHQTPFHLQKTLILDLDETLIHSTSRPMGSAHAGGGMLGLGPGLFGGGRRRRGEGHTIEVVLNGRSTAYHVYKRPYVDFFLKKVSHTETGTTPHCGSFTDASGGFVVHTGDLHCINARVRRPRDRLARQWPRTLCKASLPRELLSAAQWVVYQGLGYHRA